jgi:hypothetical protein
MYIQMHNVCMRRRTGSPYPLRRSSISISEDLRNLVFINNADLGCLRQLLAGQKLKNAADAKLLKETQKDLQEMRATTERMKQDDNVKARERERERERV